MFSVAGADEWRTFSSYSRHCVHADADKYSDTDVNEYSDCNSDELSDRNAHQNGDEDTNLDTDGIVNQYGDQYTDTDCDKDADVYPYANVDRHWNQHGNRNVDKYTNAHDNEYAYADEHPDKHRNGHGDEHTGSDGYGDAAGHFGDGLLRECYRAALSAVRFKCDDNRRRRSGVYDDNRSPKRDGRPVYADGIWHGRLHGDPDKNGRREQHYLVRLGKDRAVRRRRREPEFCPATCRRCQQQRQRFVVRCRTIGTD